ncbi:hypothetical protein J4714_13925 [Staphylococcus epidermidis]|nr:hypothetical protein [Staphylococcus epidermidis]
MRGDKPSIRIEGDVQFAAEINWLVDNIKWDVEEDLARLIGDVPAHTLGKFARMAAQGLRQFVGARMGGKTGAADVASTPASTAPVASMPGADHTAMSRFCEAGPSLGGCSVMGSMSWCSPGSLIRDCVVCAAC